MKVRLFGLMASAASKQKITISLHGLGDRTGVGSSQHSPAAIGCAPRCVFRGKVCTAAVRRERAHAPVRL
jgi:hypothetical protein